MIYSALIRKMKSSGNDFYGSRRSWRAMHLAARLALLLSVLLKGTVQLVEGFKSEDFKVIVVYDCVECTQLV